MKYELWTIDGGTSTKRQCVDADVAAVIATMPPRTRVSYSDTQAQIPGEHPPVVSGWLVRVVVHAEWGLVVILVASDDTPIDNAESAARIL